MKKVVLLTLHKKMKFSLRICSVNVPKSTVSCRFGTFTKEILDEKLYFFCSVNKYSTQNENRAAFPNEKSF